jgi:hypothetical protein
MIYLGYPVLRTAVFGLIYPQFLIFVQLGQIGSPSPGVLRFLGQSCSDTRNQFFGSQIAFVVRQIAPENSLLFCIII